MFHYFERSVGFLVWIILAIICVIIIGILITVLLSVDYNAVFGDFRQWFDRLLRGLELINEKYK